MTKQVFITSFKVSYQPSDIREVMFRPKGTHEDKYETVGDIRRSLPLIPLCLRALVRHRAHMNKFDKFSQNDFHEVFLGMCVMLFCLSYECVYFIQILLYLLSKSSRSSDPLVAEEWLSSIQTILDFMHLNEREKVLCATYVLKKDARYWWETVKMRRNVQDMTWDEFIVEFNQKYYNRMAMRAQQNEFINIKQGSMSVTEAVRKFDQLARLCPFLVRTEEERVRRMLEMFCPELQL
ncbi:hypothetical protein UlMin_016313 [Ulmus minor]